MDNLFLRIIRQWMPIAVGISVLTFIIYVAIQQDIRIGANDPQIQIAEDLAFSLNSGHTVSLSGEIDVAKSLSPFIIVYDRQGKVVSSNAVLDGKVPDVPIGVLNGSIKEGLDSNQLGENRITWQPKEDVRLATVVAPYNGGYVLVARNLREIEAREEKQFIIILLGWAVALFASFSCVWVMQTLMKGKK